MNKMKWLAVALLVCVAAPMVHAEALITRGSNELGVQGMIDFATFQGVETDIKLKYAYFFWDRISVGVKAIAYNNDAVHSFGLGLTGEYNFRLPAGYKPLFGTDFVPFLGINLDYRRAKLFDEKEDALVAGAEGGVKFFLTDCTALTLSLHGELATEDIYDDDLEATNKDLGLNLGLRFYF